MIGMEGNSGCIVERRAEAEGLLKSLVLARSW